MSHMRYLIRAGLLSAALLPLSGGCGSRLPREILVKRPVASVVTRVDLNLVEFTDIESGEVVNAGQWMDANQTRFALLTFGSRACTACNKKSREIRDNYAGDTKLAIVGVNTDADSLSLTQRFVRSEGFDFIRWSDPRGEQMIRWFMPEGRSYGVPLTVMLSREGILWSYTNDSTATVDEIMQRARATIGEDATTPGDPDSGGEPDDGNSHPDPDAMPPRLAFEGASRMKDVKVAICGDSNGNSRGSAGSPGTVVSLDVAMPLGYAVTFFHVEKDGCGAMCESNRILLERKVNSFGTGDIAAGFLFAGEIPAGCRAGQPKSRAPVDGIGPQVVPRVQSLAGGSEFFEVFASHFDWNHVVREGDDGSLAIDPVAPSITLGFDRDGKLTFSAEGAIDEARLDAFLRTTWLPRRGKGASPFARGPAWNFYGMYPAASGGEAIDFSALRAGAKYTVVNVFGESCASCMAEMKHWARTGGLFDMCARDPQFCFVGGIENGLPEQATPAGSDPAAMDRYLIQIDQTLVSRGVRMPLLMVDPYSPENDGGKGYLKRFFDGYLSARNPELGFDFRTVVSDREGKILGVFKATPPEPAKGDHVEDFLFNLRRLEP